MLMYVYMVRSMKHIKRNRKNRKNSKKVYRKRKEV